MDSGITTEEAKGIDIEEILKKNQKGHLVYPVLYQALNHC